MGQLTVQERRRVFLARALAQEAEIWLLDEPTSGLDPRHRLEFLELVARVRADRETTVLLVTHEIDLEPNKAAGRVVMPLLGAVGSRGVMPILVKLKSALEKTR